MAVKYPFKIKASPLLAVKHTLLQLGNCIRKIFFRPVLMTVEEDILFLSSVESTGSLVWVILLLKLFANKQHIEFDINFLDKIGLFIQVYDDYLNLHNPKYATVRIFCDDLDEGKLSYPIIHAIRSPRNDHRLLSILVQNNLLTENR
ncbi:terpene synthase-like [Zophobas morio]|uniref:terpene synthase-like n=1 Tax=Zophobas morio TaxID=2755281 RepID=UPI003083063F